MILEKISERKTEMQSQFSDNMAIEEIDPRVKEMYEGVKDVAHRYRSGKLPKAFKVIPKLKNWEQILFITEPHNWSSSAIYEGTKMFSHAASTMFQRFLNLVLLPRVRDDMAEFNKLNPYLYRALKKSIYKPAAFFKGLILPLLTYGDCTLREAIIFGSVISKSSIPVLHAAACLLKISEMEYTGSNSIFLRIFFGKAYALPYRVIGEKMKF
jgi:essential nuclear protein 1